jgi:hypothetical protein
VPQTRQSRCRTCSRPASAPRSTKADSAPRCFLREAALGSRSVARS